jgi:hypothetical protein
MGTGTAPSSSSRSKPRFPEIREEPKKSPLFERASNYFLGGE